MARFLALLSLVAVASAASLVLHESRPAPPAGFVSQGPAPADQPITLNVALAPSDVAGLRARLASVSTPGSADFRRWLSADDVKAFVAPTQATADAFRAFAAAHDLPILSTSPHGDWIQFATTVGQANALFGTSLDAFAHPGLAAPVVRTLAYSLPRELVGVVDAVHPMTSFSQPDVRFAARPPVPLAPVELARRDVPASCNLTTTPACLQALYGIPAAPATQANNALLVTAYDDEFAQDADLSAFLAKLRPDVPANTSFSVLSVDNGTNPQGDEDAGVEADLDIEYTVGIATGVPVQFLSSGNFDFPGALLNTTAFLASVDAPPTVMTTSYGGNEEDFTLDMAQKICDGYMALGARGISVVFAAGDGGVRGGHDAASQCTNNTFLPVFPASCPFVTSVGSTEFIGPERAVNFSSGGFSNYFPRPSYQDVAVSAFLATVPPDFPGVFNSSGRGFPDVSTQGLAFEVVVGGDTGTVGGTSASSPTFASVIALVNDRLLAAGKPALGFLNPWLYSTASGAFTDVTTGKNPGFTCPDSAVAFSAGEGWDPLTGFGTPVFDKLVAAAGL